MLEYYNYQTFHIILLSLLLTSWVNQQAPKKSSKELQLAHRVGKKSRKRQRRLDRALQMIKVGIYCIAGLVCGIRYDMILCI